MSVSINIVGDLINDQTTGLQDDDVNVDVSGTDFISADLNALFLTYLNGLNLSASQEAYAADTEAASQTDLVQVVVTNNEIVGNLVLSDNAGAPLDGDIVAGMTTLDGQAIHMWSDLNGKAVQLRADDGHIVGAIYLQAGPGNLTGTVQVIMFESVDHPVAGNDDDRVNFTDVLRVAATFTTPVGGQIGVDDDGPSIALSGSEPNLTTDDSFIVDSDSADFSGAFTHSFGTDGAGDLTYDLFTTGGASGLFTTVTGDSVVLAKEGNDIVGRIATGNAEAIRISVDALGNVTLTQTLAILHTPDQGPDQSTQMSLASLVTLQATVTDADGDSHIATANVADNFFFKDDAPSVVAGGTEPVAVVDETFLHTTDTVNFAGNFSPTFGNDGPAGGGSGLSFDLSFNAGATGLVDSVNNEAISLALDGDDIIGVNTDGDEMFRVSVDALGNVTLDQSRAVTHAPNVNANDTVQLLSDDLIVLTATATDGDGDTSTDSLGIGKNLTFTDDAPAITSPVDYPGTQTALNVGNQIGDSDTGTFAYTIGHDTPDYAAGESDFVAVPTLTGTVDNNQNPGITSPLVTAVSEDAASAVFDFSFGYDKDPITAGIQPGTAGGTLTFDKVAGTFSVAMTDVVDGFSFDVVHTNELLAKQPTGNTGHPEVVVEQLTELNDPNPLFVQFTANTTTQQIGFGFNGSGEGAPVGNPFDTAYNNGQFVTNTHEDWVSATQSTNGVAGDTIQKGELLTLRLFQENILGDVAAGVEKTDPTQSVNGVVLKFDGIGQSEDLMMVLNLIDHDGADNIAGTADDNFETTRAIRIDNIDIIKGNANVPFPYNTEFSLDNNDGLVVIESNDYNIAAGENFQIQGVQIMQSANGLTGNAINFNGTTGLVSGGSSGTQVWDPTDNDVIKIVDIGFVATSAGTIDANLAFNYALADSDGDTTGTQTINALISNDFNV